VELLVVIAIISVLAALLLPALQGALESARRVACLGQTRQMHFVWEFYVGDFGFSPPGWTPDEGALHIDDWAAAVNAPTGESTRCPADTRFAYTLWTRSMMTPTGRWLGVTSTGVERARGNAFGGDRAVGIVACGLIHPNTAPWNVKSFGGTNSSDPSYPGDITWGPHMSDRPFRNSHNGGSVVRSPAGSNVANNDGSATWFRFDATGWNALWPGTPDFVAPWEPRMTGSYRTQPNNAIWMRDRYDQEITQIYDQPPGTTYNGGTPNQDSFGKLF